MKLGVVSEGQAEVRAFRGILDKLSIANVQFVGPAYADMQPKATPAQIARAAVGRINAMQGKRVNRTIVLIDLEDRADCAGDFASQIDNSFAALGYPNVTTVVKMRKFENWLIADPGTIARSMRSRFRVTTSFTAQIVPDRADHVLDAESLLNRIAVGNPYHKGHDSIEICRRVDPDEIARNSRSFRKFLRVARHPSFASQSRQPI